METISVSLQNPNSPRNPNAKHSEASELWLGHPSESMENARDREEREHRSAGELDDETIARKRSRRVSFAETTAVHVFDRDEDFETPPESRQDDCAANSSDSGRECSAGEGSSGSGREEDEEQEEDCEDGEARLRDFDSSSPGSTVGSVASIDDENFFGPVSTSFIRSGRPSDSGMSDDSNHDITLDSTAFSLHFRSVAPLNDHSANSAGSLRMPTGDSMSADRGSLMEPVVFKKTVADTKFSSGKSSSSQDGLSDMSLIADMSRYDYGKLSPTLEALMNEVNKSIQPSPNIGGRTSSPGQYANGVMDNQECEGGKPQKMNGAPCQGFAENVHHMLTPSKGATSAADQTKSNSDLLSMEADVHHDNSIRQKSQDNCKDAHKAVHPDIDAAANANSAVVSPPYRIPRSILALPSSVHSSALKDQVIGINFGASTPPKLTPAIPALATIAGQQLVESDSGMQTPKIVNQSFESLQGSVSSLRAKRLRLLVDAQPPSLETELLKHGQRISAIKHRMSNFRFVESPAIVNSWSALSENNPVQLELDSVSDKTADNGVKMAEKDPMQVEMEITSNKMAGYHVKSPVDPNVSMKENLVGCDWSNSNIVSAPTCQPKPEALATSHLLMGNKKYEASEGTVDLSNVDVCSRLPKLTACMESHLTSDNHIESASMPCPCDSPQWQSVLEHMETSQIRATACKDPVENMQIIQEVVSLQNFDLDGKKRKEPCGGAEENRTIKSIRIQKSPLSTKLLSAGITYSPRQQLECNAGALKIGEVAQMDLTKIIADISAETNSVFSASIHKLSLQELDLLEDMLGQLQKARVYKRLSASLRNYNCLGDPQQQRLMEIRSQQDKLLYEKAKLQINCLRLDILRKKSQMTQPGIQDCHDIKTSTSLLFSSIANGVAMRNIMHPSISSISSSKKQGQLGVVISKRHELETLNQQVESLKKSLEVFCNIKGTHDFDETIKAINEDLEMRKRRRILHQDLRMWELNDMVKEDNQRHIVLNYRDLLLLRIGITTKHASSIGVNISLNKTKIQETFCNMNACLAFEFVFKSQCDQRVDLLKCLQQKTLETGMLLGNLTDVLEEVRDAKMELLNLTCSTFISQPYDKSVGELQLQLCFMNFMTGKKVAIALNMVKLNCAVYPSKPSELQMKICECQTTLAPTVLDEIRAAAGSLQAGRPMILTLCRTVSQLVHSLAC